MIDEASVVAIGKLFKPHGYKGELNADIQYGPELFEDGSTAFFVKIDNILVPFFVEKIGGGANGTSHIKFRGIDSDTEAMILANKELYTLKSTLSEALELSEEELENELRGYEGFIVVDEKTGSAIGTVMGEEEGIEYDYLIVGKEGSEETIHIPMIEEFVKEISSNDKSQRDNHEAEGTIKVDLPEGYLDI